MTSPFRRGRHFLCMNSAIVSSPCQIRAWIQMKWRIRVSGDESSYIPGTNCVPVTPLIIYSVRSLDGMIEICTCEDGKWFLQPSGRDVVESSQTEGVCYVTVSSCARQCPPNASSTQRWMLSTVTLRGYRPWGECKRLIGCLYVWPDFGRRALR